MAKSYYEMNWKEQIKQKQKDNRTLFNKLKKKFNSEKGVRVGDYVKHKGKYTRVTYIWEHDGQAQTGGSKLSSYHLGNGYTSYSGGLDSGHNIKNLKLTKEKRLGQVWIWDRGLAGGGRGVDFMMQFKVFKVVK